MEAIAERVHEVRKVFKMRVVVRAEAAPVMHGMTTDISLHAINLFVPVPLAIRKVCMISFRIFQGTGPVDVQMMGKVVDCTLNGLDGFRISVRITEIHPDCVDVVQRIVRGT